MKTVVFMAHLRVDSFLSTSMEIEQVIQRKHWRQSHVRSDIVSTLYFLAKLSLCSLAIYKTILLKITSHQKKQNKKTTEYSVLSF